ncbi:transposable element Tcb1 transposase [Trichonephila clavipes]|nr:transposable element Tcb1 transposase [Trichonephila clavipes]
MDWPPYSPDLNPIEHVWDMLGRRIAAHQPLPNCLPELRRALLDEWCNIPQDQIDNLILSMPRRCFMVSPAVQGQVRHPSIVPEFLRSTSCGMTSARGHGAIVYCLNSGSECCVKGILGTGGVMDKCVQMFDKELWRLGTDGSGERKREERKKIGGGGRKESGENGRKEKGEETEGERRRDGRRRQEVWRKRLSPEIEVKKTLNAGGVENGI